MPPFAPLRTLGTPLKQVSKILEINSSFNKSREGHQLKKYPKLRLEIGHIQKTWAKIVGDGFLSKHTAPIRMKNEFI